ncbi:hypothetical protein PIB30_006959 [Stylosanthes scabra]|uniref:Uncharacterized protein n=1 Tax=Stylosanthes scabra TaxID=79078 RepID=A0ABU6Y652_9FABA|nr:hypothetical protein [Stylosanthes scabra]
MDSYKSVYWFHVKPVPSEEFWVGGEGQPCLPPPYKKPIGRPTKREGHNSRRCPLKRNEEAGEQETEEQQPQEQQPVDGDPTEAQSHEEQQLGSHVDVVSEGDLTQGHPQLQPEDEQVDANPNVRPIAPSRGGTTNIAQPRQGAQVRQQQAPPNAVARSYVRRGAFRAKMPIVRPPAFMRSAPTNPPQGRLNAPFRPNQRPNISFRPHQSRPNTQCPIHSCYC